MMTRSAIRERPRPAVRCAAIAAIAATLPQSACSSGSSTEGPKGDAGVPSLDAGRNDAAVADAGSGGQDARAGEAGGPRGDAGSEGGGTGAPRDPAYNGIYVANGQSVAVFPLGAQGNVAPIRTLTGSSTMLRIALAVAVDSVGEVLVGNEDSYGYSSTLVYPSLASGNITPLRTLSVSGGGMSGSPLVGLAIDPADGVWVAQYNAYYFPANATASNAVIAAGPDPASIAVTAAGEVVLAGASGTVSTYPASVNVADGGMATPVRTLLTGKTIRSLAVANDTVFILDSTGAIDEFGADATGAAAVAASIPSPATAQQNPRAIAVDAASSPPVLYLTADDATGATIYAVTLAGSAPTYAAGSVTSVAGALTTLKSALTICVVHY